MKEETTNELQQQVEQLETQSQFMKQQIELCKKEKSGLLESTAQLTVKDQQLNNLELELKQLKTQLTETTDAKHHSDSELETLRTLLQ